MAVEHESRVIKMVLSHNDENGEVVKNSRQFNGIDLSATENAMSSFCEAVEDITSDTVVSKHYMDTYALTEDLDD